MPGFTKPLIRSADKPIIDRRPMTPAVAVSVFLARAVVAVNEAKR